MTDAIDLSIVMPCLNEAETLGGCIEKARLGIERSGVRGEILVADNGSEDDSVQIAEKLGARVIHVKKKGYGNASRGGIQAASGKWIVMGDADESYDFSETDRFVKKFQEGFELVMVVACRRAAGELCLVRCHFHTGGWGTRCFRKWHGICSPRPFMMLIVAFVDSPVNCTIDWNFNAKEWNSPRK